MPRKIESQDPQVRRAKAGNFPEISGFSSEPPNLEGIEREIARLLSAHWSLRAHSESHRDTEAAAEPGEPLPSAAICFGRYQIFPRARLVLRDGQPVAVGNKAFDILMALLRSPGAIVSKDEIVKSVWPTTHVVEGNLRFQMSELRKALSEDRDVIKTIPGRGYILLVK